MKGYLSTAMSSVAALATIVYLIIGSVMAVSYAPNQIDNANLNYHYDIINDARGIYYRLKTGAPGFPQGFWDEERKVRQTISPPTLIVPATDYRGKVVSTFRIVAHTLGPIVPGAAVSTNHWTIYLLVPGGSVQLNMKTDPDATRRRGIFQVRERAYVESNTAVRWFDFRAAPGVTVGYVLGEIRYQRWDRYDMNEDGVGCRWWILNVMRGLARKNYLDTNEVERELLPAVSYNWSRNLPPYPLEIKKGEFV